MRKAVLYIVWIGIVWGLQACTKENLDDCFYGLRLRVSYAFAKEGDHAPAPEVRQAKAYIFNEDDVLCAVGEGRGDMLAPNHTIDIKLAPGKYKVLVWGSSYTDLSRSYGEGIATETGYAEGVTIGKTALSDFRLFLKGNRANEAEQQEFIPVDANYDDLYYGLFGTRRQTSPEYTLSEVEIPEYTVVEENVELIRNTNLLKVSITGLSYLLPTGSGIQNADIYASGNGESYNWKNTFSATNGKVKFSPFSQQTNENGSQAYDIKIQRIIMGQNTEVPLMLYIYDKSKGTKLYELNIWENLRKAHDAEGDAIYQNQEDLDRLYIHDIGLEFSRQGIEVVVKIYIDGWEIQQIHPVPTK